MNRLIQAGIFRLKKDKVYLGSVVITSLFTVIFYSIIYYSIIYHKMVKANENYSFDPIIFNFLMGIGIVTAIFISSFVGTEYSDGTIRNKLIVGFPRVGIYLANLITCIIGEVGIVVVAYIVGVILGIPLFGAPETSAISNMLIVAINGVFLSLAYVSIFYMISMIFSSKSASAVICILIAFGILLTSVSLFNKFKEPQYIEEMVQKDGQSVVEMVENPYYLSGTKRDVYKCILEVLPSGQTMIIFNEKADSNGRMMLYSVFVIIATSTVGSILFSRKEIK